MREARFDQAPVPLGRHLLADFFECAAIPDDPERLDALLRRAADRIGARVVESVHHRFEPHGLSVVVIIAESHISAHTWPEHGVVCVDLFTCSPSLDPAPGFALLERELRAARSERREVGRGAPGGER